MKAAVRAARAFTLAELITSIGLVVLVGWVLLQPGLAPGKARAQRIKCVNNLKNLALAARIFAIDNGDHFPSELLTNSIASLSAITAADYFRSLSNEIATPKIVLC